MLAMRIYRSRQPFCVRKRNSHAFGDNDLQTRDTTNTPVQAPARLLSSTAVRVPKKQGHGGQQFPE